MREIPLQQQGASGASRHTAVYLLHIYLQDGSDRLISGSYDKNGLPEDFGGFIEYLHNFIQFYGTCNILSPSFYNRLRRRKGEMIYCSMRFENSGKTYYYTTEDGSIEIGDLVVVPAVKENLPSVVQVVGIQFFLPEKAPSPPPKRPNTSFINISPNSRIWAADLF